MYLYLVSGRISKTPYMSDTTTEDAVRLVWADSEEQAAHKFANHWEAKSELYSITYFVDTVEVTESIY